MGKVKQSDTFFVYILYCADGSYYTGYTNNLTERLKRHNKGFASRYTRVRLSVEFIWHKKYKYLKYAMQAEYKIKQLNKRQKKLLIGGMRLDKVLAKNI